MSEKTYTPGPAGDEVLQEDVGLSGTVKLEEGDEQIIDPRLLKREQVVEFTVRGEITGINEVTKVVDKKTGTVRTFKFSGYRLVDARIIAQPSARPRRNGAPPIIPGQTSMTAVAQAAEDALRAEGHDVTITAVEPTGDKPAERAYGRASLTVGDSAGERVVMDSDSGELVTLDNGPLDEGPWRLANGQQGYVCGLIDQDTAAFASDGIVFAVPTDDFMFGRLLGTPDAPEVAAPDPPAEVADAPPSDEERRAEDRGPIDPGTDPADRI